MKVRSQLWFLIAGDYGYGEDISGGLLSDFYLNPDKPGFYEGLEEYGVEYVVVPRMWKEVMGDDSGGQLNTALGVKK